MNKSFTHFILNKFLEDDHNVEIVDEYFDFSDNNHRPHNLSSNITHIAGVGKDDEFTYTITISNKAPSQ